MKLLASLVGALLVFGCRDASADEPDDDARPVLAVGAGAAMMFASGVAGITVVGADRHRDGKNAGLLGAQGGMWLAPVLSHGIMDEWTRGLWFSIPGAVATLGSLAVVTQFPDIIKRAPPAEQYAISATLTLSLFGNAIGVIDAAFADGRKAKARSSSSSSLSFAPIFGGGTAGAMLMGTL